ncbi:hypothetical protein OS493_009116 [Desmophyllum pertusum]|uniref:Centromere protein Q n=1 Tax=Desmophyllum pertusum TaxID=174260 RepID=A0A9W9Z5L1_9CNID|nr:hypothetical protein OS493_009116 [Desmophyllum pertusum]
MAKRRSRITYAPKSQPKSSGSERNQSASSNAHEISTKEKATRRNKRTNVSSTTSQEQEPIAKRKKAGGDSSTEAQSSPHKPSKSKRIAGWEGRWNPERIRDMTVTRKTYAKWKPLSLSTKKYTKQAIENTVLSVLNSVHKESKKNDVQVHLKQLSERIVKRLDGIKGPAHKGDYSKMEAESHELEDAVITCNGQVEALEKELEEQRRFFNT